MPTALLYHAVCELPDSTPATRRRLFIDPEQFAWQLAELARRGYGTVTLDEFHAANAEPRSPSRRVMLSFDDGYSHIFDVVTPILERHGFTAVVFVPWRHLGSHNDWDLDDPNLSRLAVASPDQLIAAAAGPWEIASHGARHVDLRGLDPGERRAQLEESRLGLSDLAGRPVQDLAYPYGAHDASVREDARAAGYRMAFAADVGDREDLFAIPRRAIRGQEGRKAFLVKASEHFAEFLG